MKLSADAIRVVNAQRDSDGILYTRKAMIRCGMAKKLNGIWEVQQLFPNLQEIVRRYRENFDVKMVADSMELDGAIKESD